MGAFGAVRKGVKGFVWLFKGVLGEHAYVKYKAHFDAAHPGGAGHEPPMTERQFWRDVTDRQENNPQGRCC